MLAAFSERIRDMLLHVPVIVDGSACAHDRRLG